MSENEPEVEVKKQVVYEHVDRTSTSGKQILPAVIIVAVIVIALLVFIFTRM